MANVERDYVFGRLISGFYARSKIADSLRVRGSDALRQGYLPARRFSHRVDFPRATVRDGDRVLAVFNESYRYTGATAAWPSTSGATA